MIRQFVMLLPILSAFILLAEFLVSEPTTSTKNTSGWVTHVDGGQMTLVIQENRPEKAWIPQLTFTKHFRIKEPVIWMRVGDHIFLRASCVSNTTANLGEVCTIEKTELID